MLLLSNNFAVVPVLRSSSRRNRNKMILRKSFKLLHGLGVVHCTGTREIEIRIYRHSKEIKIKTHPIPVSTEQCTQSAGRRFDSQRIIDASVSFESFCVYYMRAVCSICQVGIVLSIRSANNNNNNEKDVYCVELMDAAVAAADVEKTHHTDT